MGARERANARLRESRSLVIASLPMVSLLGGSLCCFSRCAESYSAVTMHARGLGAELTLSAASETLQDALRDSWPDKGSRDYCRWLGNQGIARLRKLYGPARWRKRKGVADVRLRGGQSSLPRFHWYEPAASGRRNSRSNVLPGDSHGQIGRRLVICLNNAGYEASLERRKIYIAVPDPGAEKAGPDSCVIDESGEDYLYDKGAFREVSLPQSLRRAVLLAA